MWKQPASATREITPSWWKERYFILKRGGLFYYELKSTVIIPVSSADWFTSIEAGDDHCMTLDGHFGYKICIGPHTLAAHSKSKQEAFVTGNTGGNMYYLAWPGTMWEQWTNRHVTITSDSTIHVHELIPKGHFPLIDTTVEQYEDLLYLTTTPTTGDTQSVRILTLKTTSAEGCKEWKDAIVAMQCGHKTHQSMVQLPHVLDFYNMLHDALDRGEKQLPVRMTDTTASDRPFIILSIDGGGIRGLLPCIVLQRIVEHFPDFLSKVDLVAGTSNGAMLAMGLAFGHTPRTMREVIELCSRSIFCEQQARYSVTAAKWSNRFLSIFCEQVWQTQTMQDSLIPALVPSFLLDNGNGKMELEVFTSFAPKTRTTLVSDVVMKSCAAPTYFPAWKQSVDGGVYANNGCDLAIAHAIGTLHIAPSRIVVLSLSTGSVEKYVPSDTPTETASSTTHNFGMYQWYKHLPAVIWYGMVEKSSLLCETLVGERFHRVDPVLNEDLPLDQPELIPSITTYALNYSLEHTFTWISKHVYSKP